MALSQLKPFACSMKMPALQATFQNVIFYHTLDKEVQFFQVHNNFFIFYWIFWLCFQILLGYLLYKF